MWNRRIAPSHRITRKARKKIGLSQAALSIRSADEAAMRSSLNASRVADPACNQLVIFVLWSMWDAVKLGRRTIKQAGNAHLAVQRGHRATRVRAPVRFCRRARL